MVTALIAVATTIVSSPQPNQSIKAALIRKANPLQKIAAWRSRTRLIPWQASIQWLLPRVNPVANMKDPQQISTHNGVTGGWISLNTNGVPPIIRSPIANQDART